MSGRLLSQRLPQILRRGSLARRLVHQGPLRTGGLLRYEGNTMLARRRAWPFGANAIHNVPAIRTISFARVIPKLALKLARIPALFGGAMIAGLAYIQYQAARKMIAFFPDDIY